MTVSVESYKDLIPDKIIIKNDISSKNYMKYICIVLNNKLNSQQKINILDCKTENQALKKINSFGINYTHSHEFE